MEKRILKALNDEFDGLSQEEKDARLDIGYKKVTGKHIIIELKRVDRTVKFGELSQQIKKYCRALKKVLCQNKEENAPFEIICVLGKPVDNDYSVESREEVSRSLEAFNARIVYYTELIENAFRAYDDFLTEHKKTQTLIEMFQQLEAEMN